MSKEKDSEEVQDKKGDEGQPKLEDVLKRLKELEGSNERLVNESKDWKTKYQSAAKEKEEAERKKAEESGDLAKQLEIERKEREKKDNENKVLRAKTLKQNIRNIVSKFAGEVHDIDDFLNQPSFAKILEDGIDAENLTVTEDAAKNYANKVFEAKPWMKKNISQENVDQTKPNGKEAEKSVNSMEYDDLREALRNQITGSKES